MWTTETAVLFLSRLTYAEAPLQCRRFFEILRSAQDLLARSAAAALLAHQWLKGLRAADDTSQRLCAQRTEPLSTTRQATKPRQGSANGQCKPPSWPAATGQVTKRFDRATEKNCEEPSEITQGQIRPTSTHCSELPSSKTGLTVMPGEVRCCAAGCYRRHARGDGSDEEFDARPNAQTKEHPLQRVLAQETQNHRERPRTAQLDAFQ